MLDRAALMDALVVAAQTLPRLDGPRLAARLHKADPGLPLVLLRTPGVPPRIVLLSASTSTCPLLVNLIALAIRFSATCRIRPGSPMKWRGVFGV